MAQVITTTMKLRDYQREAVDSSWELVINGQSNLIVMPTGTGKSVVLTALAEKMVGIGRRVLVLAHREELMNQLVKHHERSGMTVGVEMAELRTGNDGWFTQPDVVVASKDSLKNRLRKFEPDEFGLIITDEAHHSVAPSYRKIYDHFDGVPHVGVTATPDRSDSVGLGAVFGEVAFEYGILQAINDGWLVPLVQRKVVVKGLDFSGIRARGDLTDEQVANVINDEQILHSMIAPMVQEADWRRTLMFLPRVDVTRAAVAIANRERYADGKAAMVWGAMEPRERTLTLSRFAKGDYQFLANVGILTEGWDDPATDGFGVQCLAMMRPTKSRSLYAQCVGRVLRPLPGTVDGLETAEERREAIASSNKPCAYVIDFVGNSGKHELVHAVDVLAGDEPKEVRDRVRQMEDSDETVEEQVKRAKEEWEEEQEKIARIEADREAQRQHIAAKAEYEVVDVDAFAKTPFNSNAKVDNPAIPHNVMAVLVRGRVPAGHINAMTAHQAAQASREIIRQRQRKGPTYPMSQILRRHGYDPTHMSFRQASKTIDELKRNGWQRRD